MISCFYHASFPPCNPIISSTPTGFLLGVPPLVASITISRPIGLHCLKTSSKRRGFRVSSGLLPVDPWVPKVDSESIASQLFAASLFPYLEFLYYITKSKTSPKLTIFGFYFLLAFVGATTGIYESTLLTNLFIVLGLRAALPKFRDDEGNKPEVVSDIKEKQSSI